MDLDRDIQYRLPHENKGKSDQDTNHEEKDKLIEDFSSYTTLHGFHFILDSGAILRRIIWMSLIIIGFVALIIQIWMNLNKLFAREVDVRRGVEISESLPFPAVTICNQNMMRKSQIIGTTAQDYLDQLDSVKFSLGVLTPKDVPSFDMESTLKRAGHQLKSMIHTCNFAGLDCSVDDLFTPVTPSFFHGLCYTLNANGSNAFKVGAGKRQGLVLGLNAEPHEYYGPFSYEATGFKIAIHQPGTYHDVDNEGYDVSPGFFTSLRIKRAKEISMPSPYKSMCGSVKLDNFEKYTRQNCYFECISKSMGNKCKCLTIGSVTKGINVTRYCNVTEIEKCVLPAYTYLVQEISPQSCYCPQECESIKYNVKPSIAYYPSEHLWDSLLGYMAKATGLNASIPEQKAYMQNIARKSNAAIAIFYENLLTDVTEEKPVYEISQFGSDVGGNMGLFLGCSLLTICEFIDLIIIMCMQRYKRRSAKVS